MMKETLLFTLVNKKTGAQHEVSYIPGYGVIAPSLVTTNGSYRFFVACVMDHDSYYDIEPGVIAPRSLDEWELLDAIRTGLEEATGKRLPRLPHSTWS